MITITATGINNTQGIITTGQGDNTLSATAISSSATLSSTYTSTLASATPGNQALALAVANATAQATDKAIAIDNTNGLINLGNGNDTIQATAQAIDKAIAINNTNGLINLGNGNDTLIAKATGSQSYGIFGGTVDMGAGNDQVIASSFGGGVKINTGDGNDYIEGFGDATINGGKGFDTLSLGSYNKNDFNISFGANSSVIFQRDGQTLTAYGIEKFVFADTSWTLV